MSRYSVGTAIAQPADTTRAFLAGQDEAMAAAINYFPFNDKFAK